MDGKLLGYVISRYVDRILRLIYKIWGTLGITTNNYAELWHYTMKQSYLGECRKRNNEWLAYVLLKKVLLDFRRKAIQTLLGIERRMKSKNAKQQSEQIHALADEDTKNSMFLEVVSQENYEFSNVSFVRHFPNS